jgi:hypothetical protein
LAWSMVLNATFNNISVISWRLVLLGEEAWVLGENHRPASNKPFELTTLVVCFSWTQTTISHASWKWKILNYTNIAYNVVCCMN